MNYSKTELIHVLLTITFMSGLIGLAVTIYKYFPLMPNSLDVAWLVVSSFYFGWRTKLLTPLIWTVYLISISFFVYYNLTLI